LNPLKRWLFAVTVRMFAALPLNWARQIMDPFAALAWVVGARAARTTQVNIALCFPELNGAARTALGRQSLKQTARLLAEAGLVFHWSRERWSALLSITGAEHIEQARAAGRGVLILVPHFGNWECLALYLGQFSVTALYDPPRVGLLEQPLRAARERSGVRMLPIDRSGLRAMYRNLASGGVTAMLPDQVPARNAGVYAPFFGQSALTMTFAHRLIERTHPLVLLGSARRTTAGFQVEFSKIAEEVYSNDPTVSARAMNQAIEALVRTDPSQYQWEYKRFRRQPRGVADPYRLREG
jgi:KDO2-lipid IV(A) lauroyltransferase